MKTDTLETQPPPDMQNEDQEPEFTGSATYCPEDNKLRLYVGRVPRDEYLALREEGWTATPKQREAGGCDFVAVWTPQRRNTALRYAGIIEDEDMGPEDRAADRAERFSGYRDKRTTEAVGFADRYDDKPQHHGFQSYAKAVRSADRHDRLAGHACDAWRKAEYWQRRTAGVIDNALYKSTPAVRMGRIKELEADLRKREKALADYAREFSNWKITEACTDPEKQFRMAYTLANTGGHWAKYRHPRPECLSTYQAENGSTLYDLMTNEKDRISGAEAAALFLSKHSEPREDTEWTMHLKLRLAYENQMLEAQGGRAAFVEMEVGGWIGKHQIRKINKSPATGRVVSVEVMGTTSGFTKASGYKEHKTWATPVLLNVERLASEVYRAPSEEDKAALATTKKAEKAAAPKKDACPLINPTDADAERLQALVNERYLAPIVERHKANAKYYGADKVGTVQRITQAEYSARSKGAYARAETRGLCADAQVEPMFSNMYVTGDSERAKARGPALCKIRVTGYEPVSVIIITDKPQKALPAAVWQARKVAELVPA